MIKNYFKIATRNFYKHKLFTFVNVFGLAMGFSVCLLAIIYIYEAYNYDKFHRLGNRTYRITSTVIHENGESEKWATTPLPLANQLQSEFSFVENSVRVYTGIINHALLQTEGQVGGIGIGFGQGAFVEPSFFEIFDFELLVGNPKTALEKPNTLVLSENMAGKLFSKENPMGKTVIIKEVGEFVVTGIRKKNPYKSHLNFDILVSFSSLNLLAQSDKANVSLESWKDFWAGATYIVLKENADLETLRKGLSKIEKQHLKNLTFDKAQKGWLSPKPFTFDIQALNEISPSKELSGEVGSVSPSVSGLLALAALMSVIMLSACFNYTNLTLIRSLSRAREIGIRKVMGAMRKQIFFQFLSESIIIAFISLVLGYVLLSFIQDLPTIKRMLEGATINLPIVLIFIVFAAFIGGLAGSFPAWLLSAFQPVEVLKKLNNIKIFKGTTIRNGLVIFQFLLSLVMVIVLLVLYKQTTFVTTADYGFDKKNIINISLQNNDFQLLLGELSKDIRVESVSATSENLGYFPSVPSLFRRDKTSENIGVDSYAVSPSFIKTMNLQMAAGTTFPLTLSDKNEQYVILDERAAQKLGLGSSLEAVGQSIFLNDTFPLQVVGIVKNFQYMTMRNKRIGANALAFRYRPQNFNYLNVKVKEGNMLAVNQSLKGIWKKLYPKQEYEAHFYEERFYQAHAHRDDLLFISYLASIALSIACLGLLAISSYIAEVKVKEIGIRKVFGAEVNQIIWLISKGLAKLLAVATLIALPIGYVLGRKVIEDYVIQVTFIFDILPLSVLLVSISGLIIILSQTYKAALMNPVKSLRSE